MGETFKGHKGYKAFKKGLICDPTGNNPFQYAENTVFECEEAVPCKSGFHYCENPLDVLDYYPLVDDEGDMTEFAEVEALNEPVTDDNKKYSTTKIKIGAKIDFPRLVQTSVDFTLEKTTKEKAHDKCDEKITSKKNSAQIGSSGDSAQIGSSGYYAKIGSRGDSAQIGSSGDYAKIKSEGKNAVICCAGNNSTAKAKKGSWITLAEWKHINGEYTPVCVKTEFVDGDRIKEDTFYKLENGEFKEI